MARRITHRNKSSSRKRGRWRQPGAELYRLGISAGGGARETARITRETDRYNQQLAEQERRLRDVGERQRKLNAIRAKADKMRDVRNNPRRGTVPG